jgi:hypothetical protein
MAAVTKAVVVLSSAGATATIATAGTRLLLC